MQTKYKIIEINKITKIKNPPQIKPYLLKMATQSIKENGLWQPIGLKKIRGGYKLLYGYTRLVVCKKLKWKKISAIIYNTNEI